MSSLLTALCLMVVACDLSARGFDDLEHRRWAAADGGPSQVGALAQTSDGYLWLGTNASLYRFDGFRFTPCQPVSGAPLGIVSSLLATDAGLWIGERAGGIAFLAEGILRRYGAREGVTDGVVYGMAQGKDGAIWAAVNDGLMRHDQGQWRMAGKEWNLPGRYSRAVFVDRDGAVWAADESALFYLPPGARRFVPTGIAVGWASQIVQTRDGAVWIAERYGGVLHEVRVQAARVPAAPAAQPASPTLLAPTFTVRGVAVGQGVNGMLTDRDGALWVSTAGQGLIRVDGDATHQWSGLPEANGSGANLSGAPTFLATFGARDGLSADSIWPLLEDREGNVWVGTSRGLDRFRRRTLTPAGFPPDALNVALAAGGDGALWAGASSRAAMRLHDGRIETLATPAPLTSAMTDSTGVVWMGGPQGIWRSHGSRLERVAGLPSQAAPDSSVRAMARDPDGRLWVSVNRAGLFVLDKGAWTPHPAPSTRPSQRMPVTASTDLKGTLWFGYRDNLIVTRDARGDRSWGAPDGLNVGHVTAMAHGDGKTWIGGQYGVALFDGTRFLDVLRPANDAFDNVYALILIPGKPGDPGVGDLWIQAKAGIFHVPASDVEAALADTRTPIRYRSVDRIGGLANDPYQVLPLPTGVRAADGRLWFATSSGVVGIDPALRRPADTGPTAVIETLSADGISLSTRHALKLPADTRRINVDYTALSLSSPESLQFQYRLDGYDREWQDVGPQRSAIYTGLGAGDYRFRVRAFDKDGLPSAAEATLPFSVAPVFYRQWAFLLFAGAVLGTVLWLMYRMNLRRSADQLRARIEERYAERERIARELHDTLLQGVQGLMLRFQAAADKLPPDAPARVDLERALDRADQVLIEGRDRVRDLRRQPADDQDDLAAVLARLADDRVQPGQPKLHVGVEGLPVPLHPLVRDEAERVAREAVANACTHAHATRIEVVMIYTSRVFELRIDDDGRGIDPAWLTPRGRPEHWGLRGMHERAERIGATLTLRSAPASGTQIRFCVPASRAYRRDIHPRPPLPSSGVSVS
ncbi:histidine kinase [Pigmentiphaga litoralis]|uniref:sensor histidine kinase n=1 Tax=Pigmentiphaga litoralis TaxID=516702 RepID=UPI0016775577|nr:sensor histidine kinase [Pigmentiphaga litoralis]GGX09234.1 histidine kinase [Pigmentiphaga litoralis]